VFAAPQAESMPNATVARIATVTRRSVGPLLISIAFSAIVNPRGLHLATRQEVLTAIEICNAPETMMVAGRSRTRRDLHYLSKLSAIAPIVDVGLSNCDIG
jgi:hypothetical protein